VSLSVKINSLLSLPNQFFEITQREVIESVVQGTRDESPIYGQFSLVHSDARHVWLIRDRLGLNKLFYVVDRDRRLLTVGNSIYDVASATQDFNRIVSIPPGHFLKIDQDDLREELICYYDMSHVLPVPGQSFDVSDFHRRVDLRLAAYFTELNAANPGATFAVCLSGGLDSTIVASYAKRFLKNVFAITFSSTTHGDVSEDFAAARSIAEALGLEFFPVVKERRMEINRLQAVLRHCQDWRDFNVHCAWLNDHLGEALRERYPSGDVIVLTGDLMNEYVADYTPVTYRNTVYYPQPRVSRERLRRFFVYGLDTSDRETGIFHRHGLITAQPYSILAEEYLRVPAAIIEQPQCKEILNQPLLGHAAVQKLVGRAKTRAQVGGKDGGTLGLFHDNGITQGVLREHWEQLFTPFCREGKPREIIVSGRYRSEN